MSYCKLCISDLCFACLPFFDTFVVARTNRLWMWDPRQQWRILHCDWMALCVRWHTGEGVSCRLYTLCNSFWPAEWLFWFNPSLVDVLGYCFIFIMMVCLLSLAPPICFWSTHYFYGYDDLTYVCETHLWNYCIGGVCACVCVCVRVCVWERETSAWIALRFYSV